jgi:hypothetical protein
MLDDRVIIRLDAIDHLTILADVLHFFTLKFLKLVFCILQMEHKNVLKHIAHRSQPSENYKLILESHTTE